MESEAARSRAQNLDEIWKWTVGAGVLVVALAPLSLPILILTIAATLPLLAPVLVLGLLAAVVALPVMLIRKLGGSMRKLGPHRLRGSAEPAHKPATGN